MRNWLCRLAVLLGLAVSGCHKSSTVCEGKIKTSLLNPETVEFFEVQALDLSQFRDRLLNNHLHRVGGSAFLDAKSYSWAPDAYMSQAKIDPSQPGQLYMVQRVKAEAAAGNKITSHFACAQTKDECHCILLEE